MSAVLNNRFSFGEFEIDTGRRVLLRNGEKVVLKAKTFDLLLALVEGRGTVLSKSDLLDKVWENQYVEENNLTVHIAALRKALGETKNENRYIATVPGTGYSFVAEVVPRTNAEIVIETRQFQRIVVDEEIEERSDDTDTTTSIAPARYTDVGKTASPRTRRSIAGWITANRIAAGMIVSVIALAGLGGYALRQRLSAGVLSSPFVRTKVRQLTTNGKVGLAALSPDGKLFAYTIDELGKKSLWLGYVVGGNHIEISPASESIYRGLTFSPDSKDLYASICDAKNPKCALFRMPAFGGVQTKVLDEIESFSLSPDGNSIAIARRDQVSKKDTVVIASLDDTRRRDTISFPNDLSFRSDAISWSADGKRLALSVQTDTEIAANEVAVVDIATSEVTRIKHDSLREITKTAWLPDGSGLIVTAIAPESDSSVPQYVIYSVSYPSGELHLITTDLSNYGASWHNDAGVSISLSGSSDLLLAVEHRHLSNVWVAPANDLSAAKQITFGSFGKYDGLWGMDWTPDGRLIYTTSDTKSQFLSQMNSDGSEQKQITAPVGYDSVLTVTQDGRYIVFHSDRTSTIDIWRTDIDGTNPVQLTFGGKGFHPAPSVDGKWVYYKSTLNGSGQLCRVPIDGGDPEILNNDETAWMSFSPDGKYFAALHVTDKPRLAIFSADSNKIQKQFDLPKTGTLYMGSRWTADSKAVTYRDNVSGYWNQPINGGEPKRLEGLPFEKFYNFAWSKDGSQLAFVRGQEIRDVVLFESISY